MQFPMDEVARNKLRTYLRTRTNGDGFLSVFIPAVKAELQRKDEENRNIGFENRMSASRWIADLISLVEGEVLAARQTSESDREKENKSGVGSESAQTVM